jgi:hypothetical protein
LKEYAVNNKLIRLKLSIERRSSDPVKQKKKKKKKKKLLS